MSAKTVVVIGAGPAGLTAAYELLRQARMRVVVLESSGDIGGISKTVNHHGNRIDIGGHRFFSKSDWVMNWWQEFLPLQALENGEQVDIAYQNKRRAIDVPGDGRDPATAERVMLLRNRLSRIYFMNRFFSYPVKLNLDTLGKLGARRVARIAGSYARARMCPRRPEASLEDFLLNRFGRELYETFFRDYSEKVWGVPCSHISAEWGAQRIKGLSVRKAVAHGLKSALTRPVDGLPSQNTETSLIERFLYPKYGPGQMWETVAERVARMGGEIRMGQRAVGLARNGGAITAVTAADSRTGERHTIAADAVVSSMPVRELLAAVSPGVPAAVRDVGDGLEYRDFLTVGLLLRKLRRTDAALPGSEINLVPDNWIYIQDRRVRAGRLQIFNNWSPYMVADPAKVWVGLEYFCSDRDSLWHMPDDALIEQGLAEMETIGLAERDDILDGTVLRMPKAYPAYFGSYERFGVVREFTDSLHNLFLVGRNGMHRYNNQDHSMLTARLAAEAIVTGNRDKRGIWNVNAEDSYHESR